MLPWILLAFVYVTGFALTMLYLAEMFSEDVLTRPPFLKQTWWGWVCTVCWPLAVFAALAISLGSMLIDWLLSVNKRTTGKEDDL